MRSPAVSFVVPCYKLAHLLPECIGSILSQSYRDFEILIMDDCSPDNTSDAAKAFHDSRVRYIRNDSNLGALANYNKGITLSTGKYIWLISADDYLRTKYVLERYVRVLDENPRVGYVFCPGVGVQHGQETGVLEYSCYGKRDRIVGGQAFLRSIIDWCFVLAPSAMVRRDCYEAVSFFPINVVWAGRPVDLIWGGDWYLWSVFALFYDVAYLSEPMVCYRQHELSSTESVTRQKIEDCVFADIAVPWMVKRKAEDAALCGAIKVCLSGIAKEYGRHLAGREYRSGTWSITLDQFERSLSDNEQSEDVKKWIRARAYAVAADRHYRRRDIRSAQRFYLAALAQDITMAKVYVNLVRLWLRKAADVVRTKMNSGGLNA